MSHLLLMFFVYFAESKPNLYVYIPSTTRTAILERELQEQCPDLNITIYSHHRHLLKAVQASFPEAILSLDPVINQERLSMFEPVLMGKRDGLDWERYAILSIKEGALSPEARIGAIAILSRKKMNKLLSEMVGDYEFVPVSKVLDLLALLQVGQADGILVRHELVKTYFSERTEMKLVVTRAFSGTQMGLPVLATLKGMGSDQREILTAAIEGLGAKMKHRLRVDSWSVSSSSSSNRPALAKGHGKEAFH